MEEQLGNADETIAAYLDRQAQEHPKEYAEIVGLLIARTLLLNGFEDTLAKAWSSVYCGQANEAMKWLEYIHSWYKAQVTSAGGPAMESLAEVVTHHILVYQQAKKAFAGCALPLPATLPN